LPEQEFVGEQLVFGVDNGLPRQKGFFSHPGSSKKCVYVFVRSISAHFHGRKDRGGHRNMAGGVFWHTFPVAAPGRRFPASNSPAVPDEKDKP
jgi:hypothetical protein